MAPTRERAARFRELVRAHHFPLPFAAPPSLFSCAVCSYVLWLPHSCDCCLRGFASPGNETIGFCARERCGPSAASLVSSAARGGRARELSAIVWKTCCVVRTVLLRVRCSLLRVSCSRKWGLHKGEDPRRRSEVRRPSTRHHWSRPPHRESSSKNHPSCLTRRGSHSGIGHPVATNFNFNRASNKLEDPRVPGGQVSLRRQTEGATRGPCSRAVGGEERQVTGKHGHRGASHSAEPSRSAHAQHHALAAREISARFGRRVHVPPPA